MYEQPINPSILILDKILEGLNTEKLRDLWNYALNSFLLVVIWTRFTLNKSSLDVYIRNWSRPSCTISSYLNILGTLPTAESPRAAPIAVNLLWEISRRSPQETSALPKCYARPRIHIISCAAPLFYSLIQALQNFEQSSCRFEKNSQLRQCEYRWTRLKH